MCSPAVKHLINDEQNTNLIPFICHGQAPGSRKSGDIERGATEGAPSQPCAPQPVRRPGLLRASLQRLPIGVQPTSNSAANPDSCAGVEAVAEALVQKGICMNRAISLRRDLAERAQKYAQAEGLPHCLSYGEAPNVCFLPYADDSRHGNFLQGSYQAIKADPEWLRRLAKVHTRGRQSLPNTERRWMELDSSTSSDALLMNIFCHPTVKRDGRLAALLGAEPGASACFGYKARVPLANGRFDRTEVDLRLGDLLVEAKLTESDFQSAEKKVLLAYRDFSEVFDGQQLPQIDDRYLSYQLVRNVLAAYALQCSFCVLVDARRPDLAHAWYAVMKCVKPVVLRTKLRISTWQEIAQAAPPKLRVFLAAKYGIAL